MQASLIIRRALIWTAAVLALLILLILGLAAAVDAGFCRGPILLYLSSRIGRQIQVDGAIDAHLLSRNPRVTAERVTIGNPAWMPSGVTATIGKLSLAMLLPRFGHRSGIVSVDAEGAALYLARDSKGYANWQLTDPSKGLGDTKRLIIRHLSMPDAHALLADERRHLQFDGMVSAGEAAGDTASPPFLIHGTGQLNGRPVTFDINGEPLAAASHQTPYQFSFSERSSGSRLDGKGSLQQPFNFQIIDTTFEATGADLKDLYYLTGIHLIDTGDYRVTGTASLRGTTTEFSNLAATSGQSDVRGTVSVDSSGTRPKLAVELNSKLLHLADLGPRAAGRAPVNDTAAPLLLSDAKLSRDMVRRGDATVSFSAQQVDVGRMPLQQLKARATMRDGVLSVTSLVADLYQGKLTGRLKLDATPEVPTANADINVVDLQIGLVAHKNAAAPAFEGPLKVRISITGRGSSVHEVAASANGTVTALLPQGEMRDSFAELTGIDLRGLGLLLAKNKKDTVVRCAAAKFTARDGILTAKELVVDTEGVLITGDGQVHFDSEALELTLIGQPKSLRLFELHSPVLLRGTLAHPRVDIEPGHSKLAIIAPGKGKDADCAALLAEPLA
jgi:AsmA family protein